MVLTSSIMTVRLGHQSHRHTYTQKSSVYLPMCSHQVQ
uniref:Uncharacterized protein n=1 Tax=Anguilla anguilla TaxID=7936 RepID=A0A0E9XWT7_ANGAN